MLRCALGHAGSPWGRPESSRAVVWRLFSRCSVFVGVLFGWVPAIGFSGSPKSAFWRDGCALGPSLTRVFRFVVSMSVVRHRVPQALPVLHKAVGRPLHELLRLRRSVALPKSSWHDKTRADSVGQKSSAESARALTRYPRVVSPKAHVDTEARWIRYSCRAAGRAKLPQSHRREGEAPAEPTLLAGTQLVARPTSLSIFFRKSIFRIVHSRSLMFEDGHLPNYSEGVRFSFGQFASTPLR